MRWAPIAAFFLLLSPAADAAAPKYTMRGPCRVRTTSGPIAFDETYNPTLHATVTGPDKDLQIEVEGEGMKCVLKGIKSGSKITLPLGQKCPQHIDRNGIKGDIEATLTSGSGAMVGKTLSLKTTWDAAGKVRITFKKVDVGGVIEADVKGTRP